MEGWKEEGGGLVVLLLAERARSEGARPTRAAEDKSEATPLGESNERAWKD
jgi:hypothetical protein